MILYPCLKCANNDWLVRELVHEHLICNGFPPGYSNWYYHGEPVSSSRSSRSSSRVLPSFSPQNEHEHIIEDDIEGLLRDAFNMHPNIEDNESDDHEIDDFGKRERGVHNEQPNGETAKFYKLLEDMNEPLYEGSKYSKLSFYVRFFHLKCISGMSGKSFDSLFEFLKDVFPFAAILSSSYDSKKIIKDLGLGYEKIHSYPNDCMLYWDDRAHQQSCHVCGTSRWLATNLNGSLNDVDVDSEVEEKKKPIKVLRYFPLIPRLQRIFMSSKTSNFMRWHHEKRTKDGNLRHPANALAWKAFDSRYPDFASDSRNVRLALASDGFNPFKIVSTSYSTWPVVLIPYNFPRWICMKQPSFILSMIIPGEKGPGNDIDVYLQHLIKELKQLWEGVDTYDASRKQNLLLKTSLWFLVLSIL
ncbi:hypothetical protein DITRI_Ditri02bG0079600 [Diplodiscus trichospermus]